VGDLNAPEKASKRALRGDLPERTPLTGTEDPRQHPRGSAIRESSLPACLRRWFPNLLKSNNLLELGNEISDNIGDENVMSRTSRWVLCLKWLWFKFTLFIITLFGIGAYDLKLPADLIAKTQEVWSKRLGRPVSESEAEEIIRSFSNFFQLLKEIKANAK